MVRFRVGSAVSGASPHLCCSALAQCSQQALEHLGIGLTYRVGDSGTMT